ncbi:radical SAM protein [Sulfurospirillum arcachonense]|uniref:radical SAM protein n=1 Tax=Sulfurospirillum arcachonense TaxID=57666 RepID=UPI000468B09D|nr:radical SAM protein [Sulfurospirillum arcachonense]
MNKIVFGPITSRRFGQSLGIDLSPDAKQCNFDCIYCELKGAKPVDTIQNPPSVQKVVDAVKEALLKYKDIDVITLTANGEPTLYPHLQELIQELNSIKKDSKLLILSNGATSSSKQTREILKEIDIVKLSLDCATQRCFNKIDRPLKGLHVEDIVQGIREFRKIYSKELVIEILVVAGINDKEEEFEALRTILKEIQPDRIDISTVDRPPAYDVKSVSIPRLKELAGILSSLPISLAYKRDYSEEKRDFTKEEILNMIDKRPQSFDDVHISFSTKSIQILEQLVEENFLHVKSVAGVNFYKLKDRA